MPKFARAPGALSLAVTALALAVTLGMPAARAAGDEPPPKPTTPKEIGQRFGQALGVLEVCYGSKMTDKGKALESAFTGGDLDTFKSAAAIVFDAWVKVRGCTNQKDPNTCKIIMDRSCQAAEGEIGPQGKVLPGLVEFIARKQ